MTLYNPEDSPEDHVQTDAPQIAPEALKPSFADATTIADPEQKNAPVQDIEQNKDDTRAELDRVEIYFKGPTAFTA